MNTSNEYTKHHRRSTVLYTLCHLDLRRMLTVAAAITFGALVGGVATADASHTAPPECVSQNGVILPPANNDWCQVGRGTSATRSGNNTVGLRPFASPGVLELSNDVNGDGDFTDPGETISSQDLPLDPLDGGLLSLVYNQVAGGQDAGLLVQGCGHAGQDGQGVHLTADRTGATTTVEGFLWQDKNGDGIRQVAEILAGTGPQVVPGGRRFASASLCSGLV